jgi:hypothetical protein
MLKRVRLAKRAEREEAYWGEVERAAELSEAGLAPRTYARLVLWEPGRRHLRLGVVLERFEFSLGDVQMCPRLARRMFVESDGEAALVDLYARAAGRMRCIDTKPGNVVVRLPRPRRELRREPGETRAQHRERAERLRPRLALIDVDPDFCGRSDGARAAGASTVEDVDAALAAIARGRDFEGERRYGFSPLLAASMSLLVHCTVAAAMPCHYGYPYVRIARVLLSRWNQLKRLLLSDQHAGLMVPGGASVNERLKHYTKYTPEALARRGNVADAPDRREAYEVHEDAHSAMQRRLDEPATAVLAVCAGPPLADPALYEYTALVLGQERRGGSGAHARAADFARRARDVPQLYEWMRALATEIEAWRPECHRKGCDAHYNAADEPHLQRGHAFPALVDRPLIAVRRVETGVHERAPRASWRRGDAPLERLDVAGVAALLYEMVRGPFGEAVADNVARAVARTAGHVPLDGRTLSDLADEPGELTRALRQMHVAEAVAEHVERRVGLMDPREVPGRAAEVVTLVFGAPRPRRPLAAR